MSNQQNPSSAAAAGGGSNKEPDFSHSLFSTAANWTMKGYDYLTNKSDNDAVRGALISQRGTVQTGLGVAADYSNKIAGVVAKGAEKLVTGDRALQAPPLPTFIVAHDPLCGHNTMVRIITIYTSLICARKYIPYFDRLVADETSRNPFVAGPAVDFQPRIVRMLRQVGLLEKTLPEIQREQEKQRRIARLRARGINVDGDGEYTTFTSPPRIVTAAASAGNNTSPTKNKNKNNKNHNASSSTVGSDFEVISASEMQDMPLGGTVNVMNLNQVLADIKNDEDDENENNNNANVAGGTNNNNNVSSLQRQQQIPQKRNNNTNQQEEVMTDECLGSPTWGLSSTTNLNIIGNLNATVNDSNNVDNNNDNTFSSTTNRNLLPEEDEGEDESTAGGGDGTHHQDHDTHIHMVSIFSSIPKMLVALHPARLFDDLHTDDVDDEEINNNDEKEEEEKTEENLSATTNNNNNNNATTTTTTKKKIIPQTKKSTKKPIIAKNHFYDTFVGYHLVSGLFYSATCIASFISIRGLAKNRGVETSTLIPSVVRVFTNAIPLSWATNAYSRFSGGKSDLVSPLQFSCGMAAVGALLHFVPPIVEKFVCQITGKNNNFAASPPRANNSNNNGNNAAAAASAQNNNDNNNSTNNNKKKNIIFHYIAVSSHLASLLFDANFVIQLCCLSPNLPPMVKIIPALHAVFAHRVFFGDNSRTVSYLHSSTRWILFSGCFRHLMTLTESTTEGGDSNILGHVFPRLLSLCLVSIHLSSLWLPLRPARAFSDEEGGLLATFVGLLTGSAWSPASVVAANIAWITLYLSQGTTAMNQAHPRIATGFSSSSSSSGKHRGSSSNNSDVSSLTLPLYLFSAEVAVSTLYALSRLTWH